jgi:hypothetical protein
MLVGLVLMDTFCKMELVLRNVDLFTLLIQQLVDAGSLFFVSHLLVLIKLKFVIPHVLWVLLPMLMPIVAMLVLEHAHRVHH